MMTPDERFRTQIIPNDGVELEKKYESCLRENTGLKIHNAYLEKENSELKCFIRDLIHENHNLCFQFNNTTCLFNSDYRNRAEELTGEKL